MAWCRQATKITWANVDLDPCHYMASVRHKELTDQSLIPTTSRSREIRVYTFPIVLEFDMHFGSSTAEMLVKFQSGTIIITFNIADSGLHEIWRQSRVEGGYYTDVCNDGKRVRYTASCDNQWIIETRKAKFLSMFFHVNLHWKSHMSAVWVATDCIPEHVMHYKSEIMDS